MNIQRIRVPLGFLFAGFFFYFSRPSLPWMLPGLVIAVLGLAIRVWAAGHLQKWKGLAVTGPYRRTRNPLYLGSLFLGVGVSLASSRPLLVLFFSILFFAVYLPVMRREEQELSEAYGARFAEYQARVPFFFPRISRNDSAVDVSNDPGSTGFCWNRVILNREYRAVLGFLLISCFLWLRMAWY